MKKKIYFKVYQDKESMNGSTYTDTVENVLKFLPDIVEECNECGDLLFPVFEVVEMTEEEFLKLPEFTGY